MKPIKEYFVDQSDFDGVIPECVSPGYRFVSDTPEISEEFLTRDSHSMSDFDWQLTLLKQQIIEPTHHIT